MLLEESCENLIKDALKYLERLDFKRLISKVVSQKAEEDKPNWVMTYSGGSLREHVINVINSKLE
jgi:hypothetical protein